MIVPRDIAIDSFEAGLALLCGAYAGAGLPLEEIRGALKRRLYALRASRPDATAVEGGTVGQPH